MPNLTYNDMLGAYAHYPAPIRPYLLRAETHPTLRSMLTKTLMRVFIDIVARAPITDPCRVLELRIDKIANKLAISEKSVTRTLNFLREQGWLKRPHGEDGRDNYGKFWASKFILGDELRIMLGLPTRFTQQTKTTTALVIETPKAANIPEATAIQPEQSTEIVNETPVQPRQEINSTDTLIEEITEGKDTPTATEFPLEQAIEVAEETNELQPEETKMSPGVYIEVNEILKRGSFLNEAFPQNLQTQPKKTKQFKVPADLLALQTELGILPFGIFKLMRLAGQLKQRLQDVWQAKREQILSSGAKGGRAKNYLEFLLNTGEDFAYRARQNAEAKLASVPFPATAFSQDRSNFGKTFIGANGVLVSITSEGAAYYSNAEQKNMYLRPADTAPIFEAIAAGKLRCQDE